MNGDGLRLRHGKGPRRTGFRSRILAGCLFFGLTAMLGMAAEQAPAGFSGKGGPCGSRRVCVSILGGIVLPESEPGSGICVCLRNLRTESSADFERQADLPMRSQIDRRLAPCRSRIETKRCLPQVSGTAWRHGEQATRSAVEGRISCLRTESPGVARGRPRLHSYETNAEAQRRGEVASRCWVESGPGALLESTQNRDAHPFRTNSRIEACQLVSGAVYSTVRCAVAACAQLAPASPVFPV